MMILQAVSFFLFLSIGIHQANGFLDADDYAEAQTCSVTCTAKDVLNECEYLDKYYIPEHSDCVDLLYGYTWTCHEGFTGDNCTNVNECEGPGVPCYKGPSVCEDTIGSFKCSCAEGYQLSEASHECVDVNECDGDDSCGENALCVNTVGSFACFCRLGHNGNPQRGNKCYDDSNIETLRTVILNTDEGPILQCMEEKKPDCPCTFSYLERMCQGYLTTETELAEPPLEYTTGRWTTILKEIRDASSVDGCYCIGESCIPANRCGMLCDTHASCVYVKGVDEYKCSCDRGYKGNGVRGNCVVDIILTQGNCTEETCDELHTCVMKNGVPKCELDVIFTVTRV